MTTSHLPEVRTTIEGQSVVLKVPAPMGGVMRLTDLDGDEVRFERTYGRASDFSPAYVSTAPDGSFISRLNIDHVIAYLTGLRDEWDAKH